MTQIGFVGLGHMGLPMAINLIKKGYDVTGYDLQALAMEALVNAGGKCATSLEDLARDKAILITMLQKGEQVLKAYEGPDGLLDHANEGSLFIDCSTIDVQSARKAHQLAQKKGMLTLDAPVSGGVLSAVAGSLTFIVGGKDETFKLAFPVLDCMGHKIIHTGDAGSGQAAKICNNMILGISMVAISEAFILGEQLGLCAEKLFEVVNNASGQCWAMSKYAPLPGLLENTPANNHYKPGFAATMMLKDLLLGHEAAIAANIKLPLGDKTTTLYQEFIDKGHGELDFSAIITLLSKQKEV